MPSPPVMDATGRQDQPVQPPGTARVLRAYHGTGFKFDRFDAIPMFFTTDFHAAAAYALNCAVPDDLEYEMAVLGVDVDETTLEEFDAEQFLARFGSDGRHSSESWEAASNYAYDLFQRTGKAGILIRGCLDYGGKDALTQEVFDRRYDQVILAAPERYPIAERIPIPVDFAIRKPGRGLR